MIPPPFLKKLAVALAFASAVSILIGVSVSQILLAVALGVLLLSGLPLRWPPVAKPLGLFLIWTLIALAASPDPRAGTDQVRKMFVFLIVLVVYSCLRNVGTTKWLALAWMAVGTVTAGRGLLQYVRDIAAAKEANLDFYHFYVVDRISGFMSHWMTFSGQQLFILLLLVAFLLFAPDLKKFSWIAVPCAAAVGLALLLSQTRSIWLAAVVAGCYLLFSWRRWAILAMPVILAVAFLGSPEAVKIRVRSIANPENKTDSNMHRQICRRTGWAMIAAHPIFGVGPDEIRKPAVFFAYLPKDVPQPLPDGFYEHLHNIYIQYAAERGIPAMLFLVGALLLAWRDFHRALGKLPAGRSERRFQLQAAIACIIGTLVGGVYEYNLNDTEVLTMFLSILCCGYVAADGATAPRAPLPIETPITAET